MKLFKYTSVKLIWLTPAFIILFTTSIIHAMSPNPNDNTTHSNFNDIYQVQAQELLTIIKSYNPRTELYKGLKNYLNCRIKNCSTNDQNVKEQELKRLDVTLTARLCSEECRKSNPTARFLFEFPNLLSKILNNQTGSITDDLKLESAQQFAKTILQELNKKNIGNTKADNMQ